MDIDNWGRLIDRYSPIPLYQQLSDILANSIEDGSFKPGDHLPSENDLMKIFDVSRYVVRQTLNTLGRQGLIYTEHGRGSFVSGYQIEKPLDVLQSYHEGMRKSGFSVEVRLMNKSILIPQKNITEQLGLPANSQAFYIERVAYTGDSPLNILISYIPTIHMDGAKLMQFTGGSLYDYLAREFKVCLKRSRSYIEVVFAGEYESRLLNISRGSVLLQIWGVVYDDEDKPIEYSRVVYPGTKFRFRFDSFMSDKANDPRRYMLP